jgi:hypothetical protein
MDGKKGTQSAEYLAMNPAGQVGKQYDRLSLPYPLKMNALVPRADSRDRRRRLQTWGVNGHPLLLGRDTRLDRLVAGRP